MTLIPKKDENPTVKAIPVVCVRPLDVPVTTTAVVPTVAVPPTDSVKVLVLVVLEGLNDAVTPPGRPEADKLTVPVKPFCGVTTIVVAPLSLRATFKLPTDADNV